MEEEIEIRNCLDCYPVDRDEMKYRTDIIATNCTWRENATVDYTLQERPLEGKTYLVMLHQPVKFRLHMDLWLFYNSPLAYYNGYENEGEMEEARFCFGEISRIIGYDHSSATIEFAVKQALSFEDIINTRASEELPAAWTNIFKGFIERGSAIPERFGNYYYLEVTVEGDVGLNCVIKKTAGDYFICMINEWCFFEDYTFGGRYIVPPVIRRLLQ